MIQKPLTLSCLLIVFLYPFGILLTLSAVPGTWSFSGFRGLLLQRLRSLAGGACCPSAACRWRGIPSCNTPPIVPQGLRALETIQLAGRLRWGNYSHIGLTVFVVREVRCSASSFSCTVMVIFVCSPCLMYPIHVVHGGEVGLGCFATRRVVVSLLFFFSVLVLFSSCIALPLSGGRLLLARCVSVHRSFALHFECFLAFNG